MGITIAKEVKAEKEYINRNSSDHRIETKRELQEIAYNSLRKTKSPNELIKELRENGVEVEPVKNKQGNICGVRFCHNGETFKASEIGREFGLHCMFNHFGQSPEGQKGTPFIPKYVHEPLSIMTAVIETASNTISTAGEVASSLGGLFDIPISNAYPEENNLQLPKPKRKKKRGRKV